MTNTKYNFAAVEVLAILNYIDEEEYRKIPQSFIQFLNGIASKTYKPSIDFSKSVNELDINDRTKELLGFIYINWWCNDQERNLYKLELKKRREETKSNNLNSNNQNVNYYQNLNINKSNVKENITEDKSISDQNETNNAGLVEVKEESFWKKIINKIILRFKSL